MVNYSLVENVLTDRKDDYSAIVHTKGSLDKEEIISRMLNKGTLTTRTDILAVLNNLEETVEEVLLQGFSVVYPLFNTSFSISGVFEGSLDSFDGNRHKLNVNLTKGLRLREAEKKVKLEKTTAAPLLPLIQEVKDSISGRVNEVLTVNGVLEVRGNNLRIEGDDPTCGLWFINENGEEFKAETIVENKPSRIIAIIPELRRETHQVKVVTQFMGSSKFLKVPRMVIHTKNLLVVDKE